MTRQRRELAAARETALGYRIRARVRKRDRYRCVDCGLTNEEHKARAGDSLHVHRLDPKGFYSLSNCVTVCSDCHGKRHMKIEPADQRFGITVKVPFVLKKALGHLAVSSGTSMRHYLRLVCLDAIAKGAVPVDPDAPKSPPPACPPDQPKRGRGRPRKGQQ